MRYLKLYEDHTNNDISELERFCEENLASLLDNGFKFRVVKVIGAFNIWLDMPIIYYEDNNYVRPEFKWDDVKDDYIPFLEKLNSYYNFYDNKRDGYDIIFRNGSVGINYYKHDDVINDTFTDSYSNKHTINMDKLISIGLGISKKDYKI